MVISTGFRVWAVWGGVSQVRFTLGTFGIRHPMNREWCLNLMYFSGCVMDPWNMAESINDCCPYVETIDVCRNTSSSVVFLSRKHKYII